MNTEKIQNMHGDARKAAEYWLDNFAPVAHDVPYRIRDRWVKVTICIDEERELQTARRAVAEVRDRTQPLGVRGQDEGV